MIKPFRYIYGPVYSWRLGRSLGVDPLSAARKICNMDCSYCQLGKTVDFSTERRVYVPVQDILDELQRVPTDFIDYITFSGRGEPTLAQNLGDMIRSVKSVRREKVAVITNSSLLHLKGVQHDLMAADFVLAKLDAVNQETLESIDGTSGVNYERLIEGIGRFREVFQGKFALQIMLLKDNVQYLKQLGALAYVLNPHEVQLNTPLRSCAQLPLGPDCLQRAKKFFKGVQVVTCYDVPRKNDVPFDEASTSVRHGKYRKDRYAY